MIVLTRQMNSPLWLLACIALLCSSAAAADRPNIVWILSEDNSKHYLRHFDRSGAPTPRIEQMAANGVTYDRAFSNAPVCSVARTTLITGCYAPRIGTQYHRKLVPATLPDGIVMFPQLLRDAGYYTTNNAKQDYNAAMPPGVWDQSSQSASWRNRPSAETPFFHVETINTTHEGKLHFREDEMQNPTRTDPKSVQLQSYFPDTETFRYTRAKYHDLIGEMDSKVGKILDQLAADDVLEDTVVFYFGDHGGVLPRSKGYLYESGLHVPLVVRIPERFSDRFERSMDSRTEGFVEFVDFAPTVLSIAEIEIPESMDGRPFMGDQTDAREVDSRDETFGYSDRMDEKYDLNRSLRIADLKYIRHFEPFYPDGMMNLYRYKMLAYQQWKQMYESAELTPLSSAFFEPKRPESLYDLSVDPEETNDLSMDPEHATDLLRMRDRLMQRLRSMPDLSFMTEIYLSEEGLADPLRYGQEHAADISRYIDTVNLCLRPFDEVQSLLASAIDDADPLVRHWAIVAATSMGDDAAPLLPQIQSKLTDVEPFIVARAVEFVGLMGGETDESLNSDPSVYAKDPRPYLYRSLNRSLSEAEMLSVLRAAVLLQDHSGGLYPLKMSRGTMDMLKPPKKSLSRETWDYLNTRSD